MCHNPLISVIVPVYNTEPYLHRCVDSIRMQTYKNLEIILIDDGSPDNCGVICDDYACIDNRIKVIHQTNSGVSAARNAGLDVCTGDYICFVDSDDYIRPEMYNCMVADAVMHNSDICVCQWQFEYSDGRQVIDASKTNVALFGEMNSTNFAEFLYRGSYENGVVVAVWNKLYKRHIFNSARFSGNFLEDDAIHNLILSQSYSVFVSNKQLYVYTQNEDSLTNRPFRKEYLRFLQILEERIRLFNANDFIRKQSQLLYCNIYVEYYYKAEAAGIQMPSYDIFDKTLKLLRKSKCSKMKFYLRMYLFRLIPSVYKRFLVRS